MTLRLKNKVALITGGTTGIGLATAKRLAEEGAEVIVTGKNPETLDAARDQLNGTVTVVESDAGDERRSHSCFKRSAANTGESTSSFSTPASRASHRSRTRPSKTSMRCGT